MADPGTAKQRLLELRVGEISLVDVPANEEEFLIIKRLEDPDMSGKDEKDTTKAGATTDATPENELEAVGKAVEVLVAALAKAKKGMHEDDEEEEEEEEGKMPFPPKKRKGVRKSLSDLADRIRDLLGNEQPTQKSQATPSKDEVPAGATRIDVMPDGKVVIKGAKQFTKERVKSIFEAMTKLQDLVKDVVGEDALAPAEPAPASQPAEAPALKALEGLPGQLAAVTGALETVTKRLEALEKGQAVSKALPEGGDNTQPKTSFWSGVGIR